MYALKELRPELCLRVDDDDAVRLDALHDLEHVALGDRNAASRVFVFAVAVKEDGRAFAKHALLVETDGEAVLIRFRIVDQMLADLLVELRLILYAYHLVVLHSFALVA